jgi:pimeloyl-ACP methyl ester carboxylesterase
VRAQSRTDYARQRPVPNGQAGGHTIDIVRQRPAGKGKARAFVLAMAVATAIGLCACGSNSPNSASASTADSGASTTSTSGPPTQAQLTAVADGATLPDTDAAGVEWLCRPGQAKDPCSTSLTTTVIPASGPSYVEHFVANPNPKIDCFYVYPTVSLQQGIVANLKIDPAETSVAEAQASRFSLDCRVFAPIYPQLTLHALVDTGAITAADIENAYKGVATAWDDYLAHYNDGRGVVVIGHSQGAAMLISLLSQKVDDDPSVRHRLVSAIILGGNVTVPIGKLVGGSFKNIPGCTSDTETGCVIAYSSFDQQPPLNSLFGRPGQGVSSLGRRTPLPASELQVLCVNPAALGGGSAPLQPYFPSVSIAAGLGAHSAGAPSAKTPWVAEPDLYSGQCLYRDGASWLQVSAPISMGDKRTVVRQTLGPTWGLHLVDVNIALGNLLNVVASEGTAYLSQGGT